MSAGYHEVTYQHYPEAPCLLMAQYCSQALPVWPTFKQDTTMYHTKSIQHVTNLKLLVARLSAVAKRC
jgi:predicted GNAT family N-acyltransferase